MNLSTTKASIAPDIGPIIQYQRKYCETPSSVIISIIDGPMDIAGLNTALETGAAEKIPAIHGNPIANP